MIIFQIFATLVVIGVFMLATGLLFIDDHWQISDWLMTGAMIVLMVACAELVLGVIWLS